MSVLNVCMLPDRVVISTDTIACTAPRGGSAFATSKLLPLVHADMVFAARGRVDLLWLVWSHFLRLHEDVHLDALPAMMPEVLRYTQNATRDENRELQLFVVGRSRDAGRFRALHWEQDAKGNLVGHREELGCYLSPYERKVAPPVLPDGPENCMTVVRQQIADHRCSLPGIPIGGDLIVAELSNQGLHIRNVGRID